MSRAGVLGGGAVGALVGLTLSLGCAGPARSTNLAGGSGVEPTIEEPTADESAVPSPPDRPLHLDFAFRGSYLKLASTRQQLDRRLDLPLRLDFLHVFDEPYTPLDRRSDLGMTTWAVGIGRRESDKLIWTVYGGGGIGQDLNHERFVNAKLKVDFRYAYVFTAVTAEYYPWSVPRFGIHGPWTDRLLAARPFVLAGMETGYVSGEGEGDYKVSGALIYHDEQKVRDWLVAFLGGLGWSVPLSEHWSLIFSGDYKFHCYRPDEYNGWNWSTSLRYEF